MALYLYAPPSKIHDLSNHDKNIRQFPIKEHSKKCLTSTSQNGQSHQKQGEVWEAVVPKRSPKEIWQVSIMWYSEWDPGTEKEHYGKAKDI